MAFDDHFGHRGSSHRHFLVGKAADSKNDAHRIAVDGDYDRQVQRAATQKRFAIVTDIVM